MKSRGRRRLSSSSRSSSSSSGSEIDSYSDSGNETSSSNGSLSSSGSSVSSDSSSSSSESDFSGSDNGKRRKHKRQAELRKLSVYLRDLDLEKHISFLKQAGITKVENVKRLTDSQLRKLGIRSAGDRKQFLDLVSSSDNSNQKTPRGVLYSCLRRIGMETYTDSILRKARIEDVDDLYRLKKKHLRRCGVLIEDHRIKITEALKCHRAKHHDFEMDSDDETSLDKVYKILRKHGISDLFPALKRHGVLSIKTGQLLTHLSLKEMGFLEYKDRRSIIQAFKDYDNEYVTSSSSDTVSGSTGTSDEENVRNPVEVVLHNLQLSKYIEIFERGKVDTIRKARALNHTQLRSMGVKLYMEREKVIGGFRDHSINSKSIARLLSKLNLTAYKKSFAKFVDVDDCKNLTRSDLKEMGIKLTGHQEKLLEAIRDYKPNKVRRKEKKEYRKRYGASGSSITCSKERLYVRDLDQVLIENGYTTSLSDFKDVKSLKRALMLSSSELQSKGIPRSEQRQLLKTFQRAQDKKMRRRQKPKRKN